MLDKAFEALKTYNWGADPKVLAPIEEAVITTRGNDAARKDLETRLVAVLKTEVSRDAKDYVCRKLMVVGTAASVPTLAELLPNKDLSHMARYALERIPGPESAKALRDSTVKLNGALKVGVLGSLGVRGEAESLPVIAAALTDSDPAVVRAAAIALGDLRSAEAAKALSTAKAATPEVKSAVTDAQLSCADGLLAAGKKGEALAIYKTFAGADQPKHIRLAGTRGIVACAGK